METVQDNPFRRKSSMRKGDRDLLEEGCRTWEIALNFMDDISIEIPHLRCVHLNHPGRRLISVASARVKEMGEDEGLKETLTVCLMMGVSNRDVYTINMIHNNCCTARGLVTSRNELISCSCDTQRRNGEVVRSTCAHIRVVMENESALNAVRTAMKTGYTENEEGRDKNGWFGSWINVNGDSIKVEREDEEEIICTKLDQTKGTALTKRGKAIYRPVSYWNVYEVIDKTFICCIRSGVGSGINVTRVKCSQCRLGSQRKCRHETARCKVLTEAGSVSVTENWAMHEEVVKEDTYISDESGSEYSDLNEELLTDPRNVVDVQLRNGGLCTSQPKSFFSNWKARPIYKCPSEIRITQQLTDHLETWERKNGGLCFTDPEGSVCMGTVLDFNGREKTCEATKHDGCRIFPRKVTLYTLNHDLLSVVLKDWSCTTCGFENRYTGDWHGLYPATKHRAFTVELMYFWIHQSMGRGISFRAIFDLTVDLHITASYRRRLFTKQLDSLAPEFKGDRRLGNTPIRQFCNHIDLQDTSVCTQALFSCTKCEVPLNGNDCK